MKLQQLKYKEGKRDMRVHGILKLNKMYLPFNYKVPKRGEFDHKKHLETLHEKGMRWEKRIDEFTEWRDKKTDKVVTKEGKSIDISIVDCTIIPNDIHDWTLHCVVRVGGERHKITMRYEDPAGIISVDQLKDKIAELVKDHAETEKVVKQHKENLNALDREAQAATPRIRD